MGRSAKKGFTINDIRNYNNIWLYYYRLVNYEVSIKFCGDSQEMASKETAFSDRHQALC